MSRLTRKDASTKQAGLRGRAAHTARHAVPIAKNAGIATRARTQDAIVRAKPRVDQARSWAAPRVEQAGLAVRDRVGPRVSAMLVSTAHRIDVKPGRGRRWPRLVAFSAMLAAAGSAIMALATRFRPGALTSKRTGQDAAASTPAPQAASSPAEPGQPGQSGQPGDAGTGPTG